jgi:acetyl-CoA C-acetyltransferase
MADAFIIDTIRTPRGRGKAGKGALSGIHPQELLAQCLNQLAKRNNLTREDVEA